MASYAVGAQVPQVSGAVLASLYSELKVLYSAVMKQRESTLSAFILFTYTSLETASASRNMILNRLPRVT